MQAAARILVFNSLAVLVPAGLYLGREFLIPIALAILISFVLAAPVRGLERLGFRRIPAVLAVVALALVVVSGLSWLVVNEAGNLARDFAHYRGNVVAKLQTLNHSLSAATGHWRAAVEAISPDTQPAGASARVEAADSSGTALSNKAAAEAPAPVRVEVVPSKDRLLFVLGDYIRPVVHPLLTAGIAAVLVVFFLIYREDLRDRLILVCGRADMSVTTAALTDTARRVTRYLGAQTLANAVIGVAVGIGLYALAIPNPALWGLLAAVFRFVPFIGATVAGFFPVAQALAVSDGWTLPLMVLAWILLVDMASANFLEPWLFGSRTGASYTGVILAFVFWSWLWGAVGMILAMPITVCLVVLGRHVPSLWFLNVLLGDEPVLDPAQRLCQRLLAGDAWEAVRIVQHSSDGPDEKCDRIILPALARLEHERRHGLVDDRTVQRAILIVRKLVETLPRGQSERDRSTAAIPASQIVLDRGLFDEVIPEMLARVAGVPISGSHVLTRHSLASEVVARIRRTRPAAVLLACIEPPDFDRMRHITRRLADAGIGNVLVAVFCRDSTERRLNWAPLGLVNPRLRDVLASLRTVALSYSAAAAGGPARRKPSRRRTMGVGRDHMAAPRLGNS